MRGGRGKIGGRDPRKAGSRAGVPGRLGLRDGWLPALTSPNARRAGIVGLLFSVLLLASACGTAAPDGPGSLDGGGEQVEAVEPEDVLSEEERTSFEQPAGWNEPGSDDAPALEVGTDSSSGAIPAVKPYNFGRDPGGPEDKRLSLTVPKLALEDVPVFDSLSEESLKEGTVHVPATGFPWQKGASTYIAGHRIGYPGTPSDEIFYDLPDLRKGDEITVEDADGGEYVYRVSMKKVVGPRDVEVMSPVEGESVVTLQTCTLPDYEDRIIVQGELIEKGS